MSKESFWISIYHAAIQGMETDGNLQIIRATVPEADMYMYSNTLRSVTQGRGYFAMKFSHFAPVPKEVELKIVEESKREKKE